VGRRRETYVGRSVELEVLVQVRDLSNLRVLESEADDVQVLLQTVLRVALGDDGDTALCRPSQKDLCGCLAVRLSDLLDDGVVEEKRSIRSDLHIALDERLRTER
jgi:hypothetical protein